MKKYWTIQGREGLWVLYLETDSFKHFIQGSQNVILSRFDLTRRARPATFEEIHGRPKPPQIWGGINRNEYEEEHPQVVSVYYSRFMKRWAVLTELEEPQFPTHAEAIAYAQKHAHESGGEISGA